MHSTLFAGGAVDHGPRNPDHLARQRRAATHLERSELGEAFQILNELVAEGTACWEVFNDLAAMAIMQNDLEAAEDFLEVARGLPDSPTAVSLRLASLLAARDATDAALGVLSPVLRADGSNPDVLALVREILSSAHALSPVAWARLVVDLRSPTPEQRRERERLDAFEAENARLVGENRRLAATVDDLRDALRLTPHERNSPDSMRAWETIHVLDDKSWLDALLRSVTVPAYKGFPMPGFPAEGIQVGMVGSSNEGALREGFGFYRAVRDLCAKHGARWDGSQKLLDFGTGWGRYARIFMKDFRPDHVTGIDVDADFIRICRETFPYGRFETVPALPSSGLEQESFDLVIGYSVFSHLAEHAASAWIEEFARLLRPGGFIAITTQGRSFLEVCERIRQSGNFDHPWHRNLARSFEDRAACEAAYDRGEFLFAPTGGGEVRPSTFYGEALVPRGFVERHWTRDLELVEYIDDRGYLPQALIVLRKPLG